MLLLADDDNITGSACAESLEARLRGNQEITLDTDLRDFLLLTGLKRPWLSAYVSVPLLLEVAKARYDDASRPVSVKQQDTRLCNVIQDGYGEKFRTVGELRDFVECRGYLKHFGMGCRERLSEICVEYGLPALNLPGSRRKE